MNVLSHCLTQAPVFAAMPEETRRRLERIAEQRQYRRRQVIHFADQAGDFVYLLCKGRVKVSRVSDVGREFTLYLLEGCSIFGETGLTDVDQPYELVAETLEDSHIAVFRRSDILAAMLASPQAALEMLKLISERRTIAEMQVADLVFLEVAKRLAKLLLRLHASQTGASARGGSGMLLDVKFTHQELANMIGSTRETTTLILNDFKRQGCIDFLGRRIIIRNRSCLEMSLGAGSATPAK